MTYDLTDEQKKRLTEFLGKKYDTHEGWYGNFSKNPTFTTPQDAHALAVKLVEMAEWYEFAQYACMKFTEDDTRKPFVLDNLYLSAWLLTNPARFCYLVNSYLEENNDT
jgi:hypothetical protein